jgi:hypothetical protein
VTVDSVDDPANVPLLRVSESTDPVALEEPLPEAESGGKSERESVIDASELVADETAGTVSDPKSSKDTTVSAVAAGIVVAADVAVPSPTLISTTVVVAVASGTRGTRL